MASSISNDTLALLAILGGAWYFSKPHPGMGDEEEEEEDTGTLSFTSPIPNQYRKNDTPLYAEYHVRPASIYHWTEPLRPKRFY